MKENNRPLSPHLFIYKKQLTSVLSILHRISGLVLFFSFVIISNYCCFNILNIFLRGEEPIFLSFMNNLINCNLMKLALLGIIVAFIFHFLNGFRYLFWAIGKGFELKQVYLSGYIILILTFIFSCLTAKFLF